MTAKKNRKPLVRPASYAGESPCAMFIRAALPHALGALTLLVSVAFFTGTYDSAHVKLTLLQVGATLLLTLWAAFTLTARKNPFTRHNLPYVLPLLVYMAWQTLAFVCFPYKLEAAEEFLRLWLYAGIIGLIACEFTAQNIQTLTKWILAAAWISLTYGALQILNIWVPGADLLPWHGFFGKRVFSTHANPNFFGAFVVFVSGLAGAQCLRTRQKSLLVLLALGLLNLIFTESKGAWLAYAGGIVFFTFTYTNFISPLKKHIKKINMAAVLCLLVALGAAGVYSAKRFQSVSFRTYTWLSAFEMVKDSPILGTGPGSFKLVYPAYRRPQIFYIENAHNNETQHAENELLEQAATGGIPGLVLALWVLAVLFAGTFRALRQGPQDDPRRFALLGYSVAGAGLLLHSVVDISVHFASSGLLLAVFIGVVYALLLNNEPPAVPAQPARYPRTLLGLQMLAGLGALAVAGISAYEFYRVLRNMAVQTVGEGILWGLAAGTFGACVLGVLYVYGQVLRKTNRVAVCGVLLAALVPMVFFMRVFVANHYYSLGVALVQMGQPQAALGAFNDAIVRYPFSAAYRQYRANVFAMTLDLRKRFDSNRADNLAARTDFDRALDDFRFVLKHTPNHALLHQNIGQLYYSLGMKQLQAARQAPGQAFFYNQLAQENFDLAKKAFVKALALDPVYDTTYALLANMALMRRDADEAQHWITTYEKGPVGVTEPEFLARHKNNPQMRVLKLHADKLRAGGL